MFFIPASDYAFTEERLPRDSQASNIIFKDFKNFHFENLRNANTRQTVNLYVSERGLSSFY